jgi:lysophospholipase L1-like esterase
VSAVRRAAARRERVGWRRAVQAVIAIAIVVGVAATATVASAPAARRPGVWVAAWSTSPQGLFPLTLPADGSTRTMPTQLTVREIVHPSVGGTVLRVRLTNAFGQTPLVIDAATVAVSSLAGGVVPGTLRSVAFGGQRTVTLAPGAEALTDTIRLGVSPSDNLAVSLAVPADTTSSTQNLDARQNNYAGLGDRTSQLSGTGFAASAVWSWVSGVDVLRAAPSHAVVALGDSLTSGVGSTVGANARWTDVLARRLDRRPDNEIGVVNAGIAGNQLLVSSKTSPSALDRLSRDVLDQASVRTVIVLLGVNDLGGATATHPVTAAKLIAGFQRIIKSAHHDGVRVLGATMLPFRGSLGWSAGKEIEREALNAWIRHGGRFDGTIDLARAVASPTDPLRINPAYDDGDHLHLNDAGYTAVAYAIPLDRL